MCDKVASIVCSKGVGRVAYLRGPRELSIGPQAVLDGLTADRKLDSSVTPVSSIIVGEPKARAVITLAFIPILGHANGEIHWRGTLDRILAR